MGEEGMKNMPERSDEKQREKRRREKGKVL